MKGWDRQQNSSKRKRMAEYLRLERGTADFESLAIFNSCETD